MLREIVQIIVVNCRVLQIAGLPHSAQFRGECGDVSDVFNYMRTYDIIELMVFEREPLTLKEDQGLGSPERWRVTSLCFRGRSRSKVVLQEDVRPRMRSAARTDFQYAV